MTIALLFINILLLLFLIRIVLVLVNKLDKLNDTNKDFHNKNADLWKETAEILRNYL